MAICGYNSFRRPVAQWLEQGAHNALVVGSIPTWPTRGTRKYPSGIFTISDILSLEFFLLPITISP